MGETSLHVNFKDGGVLDASVANLTDLEELHLREVPPGYVLPDELLALPKLRHLSMSGANDRLVIPALVGKLALDRLDVWDCGAADLPDLPTLRHLEIVVANPKPEVAILADRFPELTHLEVWGSHLPTGELPDAIGRFAKLEVLALVSCGVATVPDAIANLGALRELQLRGIPMTQLPDAITRLPRLEILRCSSQLVGLPASLAALTTLRQLDLQHALNKGAMVSRWDDTHTLKALPKVLAELVGLERLNLDCCGVVDVAVLRPLVNLRALSLTWSALEHLRDVAALAQLEELSLEHCDRITDFTPLAALGKLRVLNVSDTRPPSLDFIRSLPGLRELYMDSLDAKRIDAIYERELELHADDEVMERYQARVALRALPPIAEIVAALDGPEVTAVEAALDQLAQWVAASSTRDRNAITAALGLAAKPVDDEDEDDGGDDDDSDDDDDLDDDEDSEDDDGDDEVDEGDDDGMMHALPQLDRAIDRHLGALSPLVLARVFGAAFRSTSDNFAVAARVAHELARRGDAPAQLAMIDAWAFANEYYDAGHREFCGTVQDDLVDAVFPELGGAALARLLSICSDDHLDDEHGDHMVALFAPALERAQDELPLVVDRLEKYLLAVMDHSTGPRQIAALWAALDEVSAPAGRDAIASMRARITDRLAVVERRGAIAARLEARDTATVAAALSELAATPPEISSALTSAMWRANHATQLDRESRRALLLWWKAHAQEHGLGEAIARMASYVPSAALRTDLDILGLPAPELGRIVRVGIERTRADHSAATLDALRELASFFDGLPPHVAASTEAQALIYGAAKHYSLDRFEAGVAALAALDRYEPSSRAAEDHDELASVVAHFAEAHEWEPLKRFARHLHKLAITGRSLERILAQLVAVTLMDRDPDGARALEPLIPAEITWDILAYNVACAAAVRGDRAATFTFTERSLVLGKSPDQFLGDSDFVAFHDDAAFVALLDRYR
jgi:Leucine-rich repeat (LRR) protein